VDGLGLEIREDWIRNYEVKRQDFGAAG
jgi:hypothetical protein